MTTQTSSSKSSRIPKWLRVKLPADPAFAATDDLLQKLDLHSVCRSAKCPNIYECFSRKVATFMILGDVCTRSCSFCNIVSGETSPVDPDEPERIALAAERLGLRHVVVTSVTRDDLPGGGAAHYAAVIRALRDRSAASCEVLIPDFQGSQESLDLVLAAGPDILNHNVETVPSLYPGVRPQADYEQSLTLLKRTAAAGIPAKSGMMLGMGEARGEVEEVLRDLAAAGVDIVTIGQYMRPSKEHPEVARWVEPQEFEEWAALGKGLGIKNMYSGPRVRSSYNAARFMAKT
jgi:lipoic acid synthetase